MASPVAGSRGFSLLVKPASADCNLRCEYCFYLEKSGLYPQADSHRMSHEVLERMISSYMSTDQAQYSFGWQGGEPTLMGTEFFRSVVELQQKHGKRGSIVCNGLQTNATLLDDAMARLFAQYHFLLGVSLDGPEEVHNRFRSNRAGSGTHDRVLRGIEILKANGVEFNVLAAVSRSNIDRGARIFEYLVDQDILFHQYIPIVEFDDGGNPLPFSITGEQWGEFLCAVFDAWYPRYSRTVSIRLFDSIISMLVDGVPTVCSMGSNCCQYFVVEHNGDVYPCDFFVEPDKRLGNVLSGSWADFLVSPTYRRFGRQKPRFNEACSDCRHRTLCVGDCLKHRFRGERSSRQLSWLCPGWIRFYDHALDRLKELGSDVVRERADRDAALRREPVRAGGPAGAAAGRNDPCPCGSGRKYKHCHGAG